MNLRCPYCGECFGRAPAAKCPKCKKFMRVPAHLLRTRKSGSTPRSRAQSLRHFYEAWKLPRPPVILIQRPTTAVLILLVMLVLGGTLVAKITNPAKVSERKSPHEVAISELRVLQVALEFFQRDCGRLPSAKEGLAALVRNPDIPTWKGPYITLLRPDPWRTWYRYEPKEDSFVLFSCGPDRTPGTADDIRAPKERPEGFSELLRQLPLPKPESLPVRHPR
ncbi:MAG: type II secretion system protein GspG [Kiritimatiellia bacterium]